MKPELIALAALFLAGCAPGPGKGPLPSPSPAAAPDRMDDIARGVRENKRWATPEDRKNDLEALAREGRKEHVDALLKIIEKEEPRLALPAIVRTATLLDAAQLALVRPLVESKDDTTCMRGLFVLTSSRLPEVGDYFQDVIPQILTPDRPMVAGVALGTLGACQATGATKRVIDFYNATEHPVAIRCLGVIWNRTFADAPLPKEKEGLRLLALLLTHSLTMSAATTPESSLSMLRIMTGAELEKFLSEQSTEKFSSRVQVVEAAALPALEGAKGLKVHTAFLKNPDPAVIASILWTSPHALDPKLVTPLLEDDRSALDARVCDYAAQRLAAVLDKASMELPKKKERDDVVKKWRDRMK